MLIKFFLSSLIFFLALFFIGQNLDKPFWGEHDWNGVRYGTIARNFLRQGVLDMKFAQVENSGPLENQNLKYYTHYPPLLPIVISLSYKLLGVNEFSTRIVPVIATSGSITLIFLIGSLLFETRVGIVASFISLLTPMTLYFGKNASHEPLTLFFILLSFYGYLLYTKKKKYSLYILVLGLIFAQLTAWAGYFLIPAITLVMLLKKDRNGLKFIIPFWLLAITMFLIHVSIVYQVTGKFGGGNLIESLLQRSGIASSVQPEGFSLISYVNRLRIWFSTMFTLTLTLLSIIWISTKLIKGPIDADWYVLILGVIGLIYVVVFSNAVYIHNYLIFYFLPFLTLTGASLLFSLQKIERIRRIYLFFIMLVLFLVANERREFLIALQNSQPDKFAVEVGKAISQNTRFNDKVFIIPSSFSEIADNFLKFYSDRQLIYSDSIPDFGTYVLIDQQTGKFDIIKK